MAQFQDDTQVLQTKTGTGLFGWAVADLQDINQDGVTDYIVSSTGTSTTTVYSGADGQLLHTFTLAGSSLSYAVADAGDIDGDGVNDIITGGPLFSGSKGIAIIYSGTTGQEIWRVTGDNNGDRLGVAVSAAGDVNGDGREDFMVGAESYASQGVISGRVYIYSGMNGQVIRTLEAESSADRFGGGVALLDDLNSDGVGDHVVGAYDAGPGNGGKAYVYSGSNGSLLFELNPDAGASAYGQFFVANVGDVDADGTADIYVADYNHGNGAGRVYIYSGANQQVLHKFSGAAGEGAGPGRYAGDVDNDGHADIIVGFYTAGPSQAGRVTVFSGKDGAVLQTMNHNVINSQLGFDAVGIGDVNGDGKFDYLLTAANGNIVYVVAGTVERPVVNINAAMSGAWFNPLTTGQGIFLDVLPQRSRVFMGMFTFELSSAISANSAILGDSNHRWLTGSGLFSGNQVSFEIALTQGGAFNEPVPVNNSLYGTISLTFIDCENARLEYDFIAPDISGTIPLSRLANDNVALCQTLSDQVVVR